MSKKIIIGAVVFFLLALGLAWYFIFIKSPLPAPTDQNDPGQFLPLDPSTGSGRGDTSPDGTNSITDPSIVFTGEQPRLIKLSNEPLSGIGSYIQGSTTIARYAERASSHVTDVNLSVGTTSLRANTTITGVYESVWAQGGTRSILRYIDASNNLSTYSAEVVLPKTSSSSESVGELRLSFLPRNIEGVAISPRGTRVFYFVASNNGVLGFIAGINGGQPTQIFSSPLTEWLVSWPEENTLILSTKPGAASPGFVYSLSTTGSLKKLIGGISGLTVTPNHLATLLAYTDSSNNLFIYDIKTSKTQSINLTTYAEKCTWSTKNSTTLYCTVPAVNNAGGVEDWYKGLVTSTDSLYAINALTGSVTELTSFQANFGQAIDAIHITLSPTEEYLFFINKKDYTGWSFRIAQ